MPNPIRTFIAIELDDAHKRTLADLQTQLKRQPGSNAVRWVAAENIHLTLKFIGSMDGEKMPALYSAVASVCADTPPFTLKLQGVGAFPNLSHPNVVWVGVQGDIAAATTLAQKIDDACAGLGFVREERPFSLHLTLGRVKRDASARERQSIGNLIASAQASALGDYRVENISVVKSELGPGGSVYTRLSRVGLK